MVKKVETKVSKTKKEVKGKVVKKATKVKKEKKNVLKDIFNELSKVKWPTGKEIFKYSLITVMFCLLLVLFFQLIDLIAVFVRGLL